MKNTTETPQSPKELLEGLRTLVTEAETLMSDSPKERATEPATEAMGSLRTRVSDAREQLGDLYGTAKDKAVAGARSTDTVIRGNPYWAIAIGIGVGMVAGAVLGRRGT